MAPSVDLNCKASAGAIEVENVRANWVLPADAQPADLPSTEPAPEQSLWKESILPKLLSPTSGFERDARSAPTHVRIRP